MPGWAVIVPSPLKEGWLELRGSTGALGNDEQAWSESAELMGPWGGGCRGSRLRLESGDAQEVFRCARR